MGGWHAGIRPSDLPNNISSLLEYGISMINLPYDMGLWAALMGTWFPDEFPDQWYPRAEDWSTWQTSYLNETWLNTQYQVSLQAGGSEILVMDQADNLVAGLYEGCRLIGAMMVRHGTNSVITEASRALDVEISSLVSFFRFALPSPLNDASYGNITDWWAASVAREPQNITAFLNRTADQCRLDICSQVGWTGNPDIAGAGVSTISPGAESGGN